MKLHDLQVGQRFTFTDKHRGKVFEVTSKEAAIGKMRAAIQYRDVATNEIRYAVSNRKTFRADVCPVTENRVVELTPHEVDMLQWILYGAYTESESEATRSEINKLSNKITGLPGRRVVLTEGV